MFCGAEQTAGQRPEGFAAIKLTALGRPELLQHLSVILTFTRNLFDQFTHFDPSAPQPTPPPTAIRGAHAPAVGSVVVTSTIPDQRTGLQYLARTISLSEFRAGIKAIGVDLSDPKVERVYEACHLCRL